MAKNQPLPADERVSGMAIRSEYNCGQCRFFKGEATYKHPCKDLGEVEQNPGCDRFKFDIRKLEMRKSDIERLSEIGMLTAGLSRKVLHALPTLIDGAAYARSKGFYIGQKVWVQVCGDKLKPYVNNFARGVITSVDKVTIEVHGKGKACYTVMYSSVKTAEEWKRLKKKLIKNNKLNDPKNPYKVKVDEEVPLIATDLSINEDLATLIPKSRILKVKKTIIIRDSDVDRGELDFGDTEE